jgi:RecB family endonuclease NucS
MDSSLLHQKLIADLDDGKTILLVSNCSIEYWGRSRSVIGCGDRIILLKPDSTLIIHSLSGFKPVNWMSAPTDTSAELVDGKVVLFSQRTTKPYEEIRITVESLQGYQSFLGLSDREKLSVTHTEHDMRDYLAAHPLEVDPGFRLKSVEYKTPMGLIDLYGKVSDKYCVVELKSERAGLPAVLQLKRYRDWLREHLRQDVVAILMAPGVAANPLAFMKKEGMVFRKFNVHKLNLDKKKQTLDRWLR